jgi:hypothetical protein
MSRRNLLNLGLLILVAALVLVTVYEPGKQPPPTVKLTNLNKKDIHRIKIERPQGDTIVLQRQGDDEDEHWELLKPYKLPASDFKVGELLRLADAESHAQRDLSNLDKSKFGLDKPRASLVFNDNPPLLFGDTDPVTKRRYVAYKNTLHLITDTFYYQLGRHATGFADTALLPGKQTITGLELPELKLQMSDKGWQLQPPQPDVSRDRLNELADNWKYAHALRVEPFTQKKGKTHATLKITRGDNQILTFVIISRKPKFVLARPRLGVQYELSPDQYQELMQLPPKVEPEDTKPPAPAEASADHE